ncbi:hypothetical protein WA158_007661 [Blastocystis sp. Blastoise]
MEKIESVIVHPLVLLSATDHIVRLSKISNHRVVGILLGSIKNGVVDCTSSFAVPFDEDSQQGVWYIDFDYLEKMKELMTRVNVTEKVVGFYSSNPKALPLDLEIDAMLHAYTPNPVFVTIDIDNDVGDLPAKAFISEELATKDGKDKQRVFRHLNVSIESLPVEEVGVEYMLKGINNTTLTSLSEQIHDKIIALKGLCDRLYIISQYLDDVSNDMSHYNIDIINEIQNIMNLLPNLQIESLSDALISKTNEFYAILYLSTIIRSMMPIYDLLKKKEEQITKKIEEVPQKKERSDSMDSITNELILESYESNLD